MDAAALWQRYQDWLYYHEGLEFTWMSVGCGLMMFCRGVARFEKAFQDMAALEGGAIANPDENCMVGHYWLRDPT